MFRPNWSELVQAANSHRLWSIPLKAIVGIVLGYPIGWLISPWADTAIEICCLPYAAENVPTYKMARAVALYVAWPFCVLIAITQRTTTAALVGLLVVLAIAVVSLYIGFDLLLGLGIISD